MFDPNNSVAVIGSTNWDICMYLQKLPEPGETVGNGELKNNLGGKGANQAVAAHLAGAKTTFISCIGDDTSSSEILFQLGELGLDTEGMTQTSNTATGTACIFIDAQGENCIGLTPGANAAMLPNLLERQKELIKRASVMLLQLEIPMESVICAAKIARDHQQLVILNPAPAQLLPDEIYPYIDLMTPNKGELAILTGMAVETEEEVILAAKTLLEKQLQAVVVTLGSEGALLVTAREERHFPAVSIEAVDTTAAGDCFNGYLAASLAKNGMGEINGAIKTAIAAAAFAVSRPGAIPSLPSAREVETLLQSNSVNLTNEPHPLNI